MNEKVQNTGEPMPNFFLGVDSIVFLAFFFQILSPPPPHKGSAVSLDIGLTQNCIATAVPPSLENLTIAPRGRQENAK